MTALSILLALSLSPRQFSSGTHWLGCSRMFPGIFSRASMTLQLITWSVLKNQCLVPTTRPMQRVVISGLHNHIQSFSSCNLL